MMRNFNISVAPVTPIEGRDVGPEIAAAVAAAINIVTEQPLKTFKFTPISRNSKQLEPWANIGVRAIVDTRQRYL